MFGIGDFARLGGVSIRMLRHYDDLGLLIPALVNPDTGYRSYEASQLSRLNRLVVLKDLGFKLEQVGSILEGAISNDELRGMLRLRQAELQSQIASDQFRLAQIESRLGLIENEDAALPEEIHVRHIPAVRVAEITGAATGFEPEAIGFVIKPMYGELIRRLNKAGVTPVGQPIAYYEDSPDSEGIVVHATLPVNVEPSDTFDFDIVDLPEIKKAVTILHHGSMDNVMSTIQLMARWIDAHEFTPEGYNRELYLALGDDVDTWITQLQQPIEI